MRQLSQVNSLQVSRQEGAALLPKEGAACWSESLLGIWEFRIVGLCTSVPVANLCGHSKRVNSPHSRSPTAGCQRNSIPGGYCVILLVGSSGCS